MAPILTRRRFMRQILVLPFAWMQNPASRQTTGDRFQLGDLILYRILSFSSPSYWSYETRVLDTEVFYKGKKYLGGSAYTAVTKDFDQFGKVKFFTFDDLPVMDRGFIHQEQQSKTPVELGNDNYHEVQFVRKISRNQEMSKIPEIAFELNGGIHFATKAEKREIRERNQK